MGIISSTFTSLALQFAWNYQRLLDPRYRCAEVKKAVEYSPPLSNEVPKINEVTQTSSLPTKVEAKLSLHQEKRRRRAAQLRYRGRPSSFDASFIVRCPNRKCVRSVAQVVTSKPNFPRRQRTLQWEITSSSGCSSDSASDFESESDSDTELRINLVENSTHSEGVQSKEGEENGEPVAMTAAEEAALRITVGRGHFSQSKKDRFLNNLRLEKRLNDLNNDFFGAVCRAHCHTLPR
ncbi:uncharacterized protein LOC122512771 [Leptopilina heterotoma]|uniref:uncharacterized protein LOC122512771 n=1 Tax=Leptopilina heterotoma TaxID=63436 RepID=UPI001CA976AD|nr:uncharacterized protein LOC122512771 [Leptopilina heterotoma]